MAVLVLNSGSSSLKYGVFSSDGATKVRGNQPLAGTGAGEAASALVRRLQQEPDTAPLMQTLAAVGHRVVHGGDAFTAPTVLDEQAMAALEMLSPLAPLHNPPALAAIRAARHALGGSTPHVAVFDTAFFSGLPQQARTYALPKAWNAKPGARRYGFHGIAHRSMYEHCPRPRVVTLQLGRGCSVAAIRDGQPLDTSMGATPLEGLVMGTRSGDVDPGLLLRIMEEDGLTPAAASDELNRRAGLVGLSGGTAGMDQLLAREAADVDAALAVRVFCHRARKYLGAYLAVLGGADAVLFGGGIGENAAAIRGRICDNMQWCGLALDAAANAGTIGISGRISAVDSRIEVHVVAVDEESLIARDTLAVIQRNSNGNPNPR